MSPQLVTSPPAAGSTLQAKHVYVLAAICLAAGLAIGFVCFGNGAAADPSTTSVTAPPAGRPAGSARPVSLADMKHMADQQAAPLLQQVKANPANTAALAQLGAIYHVSHEYKEAAGWYDRAVQTAPRDVALRTKLATSLYRAGDADGAIAQLDEALKLDPKDANSLFNLGMIRLQGKADAKGALAAWRQLLRSNPDLAPARKAAVQNLIAQVTAGLNNGMPPAGGQRNGRH